MKKILTFALGLILFLGLCGCTSESFYENNNDNKDEKIKAGLNESAVYDYVSYTITNVEYSNGSDWDEPASGNEFVIISIKIENNSDDKVSYNTYDWKMINSQGQEDSESFTIIDTDTNLGSGDLLSGGTKEGTIVFEEPKDDTSLKLVFYGNLLLDDEPNIEFTIK